MKLKWTVMILLLSVLLVTVGCGKKAEPDPPAPEPVVEETKTTPPPTPVPPPTKVDRTPDPLDAELVQADEYARNQGLLGDIFFAFDKYDLSNDARDRLARNASFLKEKSNFVVTIEGHCDERGTNDYNIALGDKRANAAKDYLVSLGISAARIKTLSYGEERPVCTASNDSCWARNRRGEFHLTGRN